MKNMLDIFGDYSSREVKRIMPIVKKIEALEDSMGKLKDEELRGKTVEFKERLKKGETLDDILPEAFAVAREAAWRVLGMKHYPVQLIGGIILHQGRVAEMKTGEGKTLVATLPAYLNALEGKGVHIVTTNDYLAARDKDEMGQVHQFLGLEVGVILNQMEAPERRNAYNCDITYGTNSEYGFDYLRDNMVAEVSERVQRKLNFAIIDELDSIFIDEARTPLIISGAGTKSTLLYKKADRFVKSLKKEDDYVIDEKTKAITLTEEGIEKAEKYYGVENFTLMENIEIQHHTVIALRANYVMNQGVDYIIRDGEIMIVDQFTGRVMDGRRFNEGLHQAIEAKERVKIMEENDTLATVTYQNYFKLYKKLAGMSGTVITESQELQEIYSVDVVAIPTNKPVLRIDREDKIYPTELCKFKAIVDDIIETYKKGQPALVGTVSVDKSEILSFMLKKKGIPHEVLNAKEHAREAEIVAKAGEKHMVTIATNMAGRGTDIKLGEDVIELGGLKIIGTERHEARRIDNQLRGRSGRQGDVGESVFYVSLEDEIIERFAKERLDNLLKKNNYKDGEQITSTRVYELVNIAQRAVESTSFETRKNLVKFDEVLNSQRVLIYKQRNEVVEKSDVTEDILSMMRSVIDNMVEKHLEQVTFKEKKEAEKERARESVRKLIEEFMDLTAIDTLKEDDFINTITDKESLKELLYRLAEDVYTEKQELIGEEFKNMQKRILLLNVDRFWVQNIENMDNLKKYIVLESYNQKDPVVAYRIQGSVIFEDTIETIKKETVKALLGLTVQTQSLMETIAVD